MNPKRLLALSVGIGSYRQLPRLICAPHDARDFAAVLDGAIPRPEIKVLTDMDATRDSILNELAWLAGHAGPLDTAILFFSGHGLLRSSGTNHQAFFCPVDASLFDLERTCITSAELREAFRAVESERLIVMLDTCYSGAIGEPRNVDLAARLNSQDVNPLIEGSGRVILAASRPDERAWELAGMRNGLFTNYVLKALRGEVAREDGSVWVSDIFSYVSREVLKHQCQRPYQKAIGEDFVVLVQKNKTTRQLHTPSLAPSETDQRRLRLAMRTAYNRDELSILCRDLGLSLEDLPGRTLETQFMDLIDHCHRHGLYDQLLVQMKTDRPHLTSVA